jgi:hypothetical protein
MAAAGCLPPSPSPSEDLRRRRLFMVVAGGPNLASLWVDLVPRRLDSALEAWGWYRHASGRSVGFRRNSSRGTSPGGASGTRAGGPLPPRLDLLSPAQIYRHVSLGELLGVLFGGTRPAAHPVWGRAELAPSARICGGGALWPSPTSRTVARSATPSLVGLGTDVVVAVGLGLLGRGWRSSAGSSMLMVEVHNGAAGGSVRQVLMLGLLSRGLGRWWAR